MKFSGKVIDLLPWLKAQTDADLRGQPADAVDQALARLNDPQVIDELFSNLQARTHGAGKIDPPPAEPDALREWRTR